SGGARESFSATPIGQSRWVLLGLCLVGFWVVDSGSNLRYIGCRGG
ncbi:hypothetical protein A2U01_0070097, partial [Trifolium medium]|nr:hypothetical protein [Trifolium medium]